MTNERRPELDRLDADADADASIAALAQPPLTVGDDALRARFERLSTLRSAWSVLDRSGLTAPGAGIAEAGLSMGEYLTALASVEKDGGYRRALVVADAGLDEMESSMRDVTAEVPLGRLRATLPEAVTQDRAGVLELLDVMLGSEDDEPTHLSQRITAVDYLITLLCTDGATGAGVIPHDPVTLTPKLRMLCEKADSGVAGDAQLPGIEADFYAAADLGAYDPHALDRQKAELGTGFFAPGVLRAITTYNASLLERARHAAFGDDLDKPEDFEAGDSVFGARALPELVAALRRRAAGEPQSSSPTDRVAWCLDLTYPTPAEMKALLKSSLESREDARARAVLVGLLCRSLVVLSEELPVIDISPDALSSDWVTELDDALKREVNERILNGGYEEACALSELRTKFLYSPMQEVHESRRAQGDGAAPRTRPDDPNEVRRTAKVLAREALEGAEQPQAETNRWRKLDWPLARLLRIGGAALAVAALAGVLLVSFSPQTDRKSMAGDELALISPYLAAGQRDGEGLGSAFVGTLYDSWPTLSPAVRKIAAVHMIAGLRAQGVRNIVIYDEERRVRIQALGQRSIRMPHVATTEQEHATN